MGVLHLMKESILLTKQKASKVIRALFCILPGHFLLYFLNKIKAHCSFVIGVIVEASTQSIEFALLEHGASFGNNGTQALIFFDFHALPCILCISSLKLTANVSKYQSGCRYCCPKHCLLGDNATHLTADLHNAQGRKQAPMVGNSVQVFQATKCQPLFGLWFLLLECCMHTFSSIVVLYVVCCLSQSQWFFILTHRKESKDYKAGNFWNGTLRLNGMSWLVQNAIL